MTLRFSFMLAFVCIACGDVRAFNVAGTPVTLAHVATCDSSSSSAASDSISMNVGPRTSAVRPMRRR